MAVFVPAYCVAECLNAWNFSVICTLHLSCALFHFLFHSLSLSISLFLSLSVSLFTCDLSLYLHISLSSLQRDMVDLALTGRKNCQGNVRRGADRTRDEIVMRGDRLGSGATEKPFPLLRPPAEIMSCSVSPHLPSFHPSLLSLSLSLSF